MKNLGAGRLAMMLVTFFGLIIFFVFIAVRSSAPSMNLLYGDLSTGDATEIAAKLDNSHIAYTLSEDGTKVSVPFKDVSKARVLLAAEGLPHKGSIGYEIFDQKNSFGRTSFENNVMQLRATEGELARTISSMDQIRSARVQIVYPERELFSRTQQPATASVFLNVRSEGALGAEPVAAIQHMIAAAVPQLKPSNVTVIDQNGNLLAKGQGDGDAAADAHNGDDAEKAYETRMKTSVEDMVSRIVGYGKVRANVTAAMNFDVVNRNSESYNPDGQVVRSTQTVSEDNTEANSSGNGAVSVQNNLPGLPAGGNATQAQGPAGGAKSNRTEETTNYEITKTTENLVRESGQVEKLSIAVLVDGSYAPDTTVQKPKDAAADWTPPRKYTPRSDDELAKIATLVKSAVGFDESRGDTVSVVNMQFADTEQFSMTPVTSDTIMGFPKGDILSMAETLALSVVAVLIILLVLRPLATHFTAPRVATGRSMGPEDTALLPGQTPQAQLAGPAGGGMGGGQTTSELESMIDMSSVEGKVKASSVQKISDLVTNHPNETVSVIRQWMSQES